MKIYAGLSGLMGDAFLSTRLHQYLRLKYPDAEIIGGIAQQFSSILPLLKKNPFVNRWVIWSGYCDSFPSKTDKQFIDNEKFDLFFHPNPGHSRADWFNYHNQIEELFFRYGLKPPKNLKITFPKFPLVDSYKNVVGIVPFANNNSGCKCLSVEKANEIVEFINQKGYDVIQLGAKDEPQLKDANQFSEPDWIQTASFLSSCRFLITTDTCCSWLSSSFSTPKLGLYAINYYNGAKTSLNWQPVGEPLSYAKYLEAPNANDIPNELIFKEIEKLCL